MVLERVTMFSMFLRALKVNARNHKPGCFALRLQLLTPCLTTSRSLLIVEGHTVTLNAIKEEGI